MIAVELKKMRGLPVAKNFWRNRCRIVRPLLPRLNSKNKTKKKIGQTREIRAGRWSSLEGSEGLRDGSGFSRIFFMGEDGDVWKKTFFVLQSIAKGQDYFAHRPCSTAALPGEFSGIFQPKFILISAGGCPTGVA